MTPTAGDSLRIGCVKYLNAQPLIYGWPGPVVFDHPSTLCRHLAAGQLDVALVSCFEFLRNPVYTIVDDVAVASDGAVCSVFLVHAGPIDEIEEIALDPASATSVNLLRCLLAHRNLNPRLAADNSGELGGGKAKLMIGDQAIRFRARHPTRYNYWDLGAEWKSTIGLPFVFALWLIRPEVADPAAVAKQLRALRDANLEKLEDVIAAQKGFSAEFCEFYFRTCLRFRFSQAEKDGLLLFRSLCEKHGILEPNATPLRLV